MSREVNRHGVQKSRARVANDDEALRANIGHGGGRRDQAHRDLSVDIRRSLLQAQDLLSVGDWREDLAGVLAGCRSDPNPALLRVPNGRFAAHADRLRPSVSKTDSVLVVRNATASASPIRPTPCKACRPAGWACGCSPARGYRSTGDRRFALSKYGDTSVSALCRDGIRLATLYGTSARQSSRKRGSRNQSYATILQCLQAFAATRSLARTSRLGHRLRDQGQKVLASRTGDGGAGTADGSRTPPILEFPP